MCLPWNHKWVEKERFTFIRTYYNINNEKEGVGYILKCEKCGKLKEVRFV